jgi:lipid A ethanolaminephosphotransferase
VLKPQRPEILAFIVAVYVVLVLNQPFWRKFFDLVAPHSVGDWLFAGATLVAMVLLAYLVFLAISLKPLLRILVLVLVPVTAAASYFTGEYGIVIDAQMVRNIFETDLREASDLITWKLVGYVVFLGFLPAVLFCLVPWTRRSFRRDTLAKLKYGGVALVVAVSVLLPIWGNILSLGRAHRDLRMMLTPTNYISAFTTYLHQRGRKRAKIVQPFGADAHQVASNGARKSLFVIVVGETARADHFALNGYARPTNPALSKVPELINYPKAYSCGTDTAQSLPCMFSGLGHDAFSNAKAEGQENLLDILKRADVDVLWRENQAGCKGVCARVDTEILTGHKAPTFFPSSENYDDVLVDGLADRISKMPRDTVVVLHMIGSHGPTYWKRYPPGFETFLPACKDAQFSRCDLPAIVNAYDNTLVYTDHVLARLIGVLSEAANSGVDTGMWYVSDHGESLGERGMYLHGMPYAIAPEAQIHVPMIVWLSQRLREARGIDRSCIAKRASERVSHDNLFHSTLGIMDVETSVYQPSLDLFSACRNGKREKPITK